MQGKACQNIMAPFRLQFALMPRRHFVASMHLSYKSGRIRLPMLVNGRLATFLTSSLRRARFCRRLRTLSAIILPSLSNNDLPRSNIRESLFTAVDTASDCMGCRTSCMKLGLKSPSTGFTPAPFKRNWPASSICLSSFFLSVSSGIVQKPQFWHGTTVLVCRRTPGSTCMAGRNQHCGHSLPLPCVPRWVFLCHLWACLNYDWSLQCSLSSVNALPSSASFPEVLLLLAGTAGKDAISVSVAWTVHRWRWRQRDSCH